MLRQTCKELTKSGELSKIVIVKWGIVQVGYFQEGIVQLGIVRVENYREFYYLYEFYI